MQQESVQQDGNIKIEGLDEETLFDLKDGFEKLSSKMQQDITNYLSQAELSTLEKTTKKLAQENKTSFTKDAESYVENFNKIQTLQAVAPSDVSGLVQDQANSLKSVLLDNQTASVSDQNKSVKQLDNIISVLEDVAEISDYQQELLKVAKQSREDTKHNTKILSRMGESITGDGIAKIGGLIGAKLNSPLIAMASQFIGTQFDKRKENKAKRFDTLRDATNIRREELLSGMTSVNTNNEIVDDSTVEILRDIEDNTNTDFGSTETAEIQKDDHIEVSEDSVEILRGIENNTKQIKDFFKWDKKGAEEERKESQMHDKQMIKALRALKGGGTGEINVDASQGLWDNIFQGLMGMLIASPVLAGIAGAVVAALPMTIAAIAAIGAGAAIVYFRDEIKDKVEEWMETKPFQPEFMKETDKEIVREIEAGIDFITGRENPKKKLKRYENKFQKFVPTMDNFNNLSDNEQQHLMNRTVDAISKGHGDKPILESGATPKQIIENLKESQKNDIQNEKDAFVQFNGMAIPDIIAEKIITNEDFGKEWSKEIGVKLDDVIKAIKETWSDKREYEKKQKPETIKKEKEDFVSSTLKNKSKNKSNVQTLMDILPTTPDGVFTFDDTSSDIRLVSDEYLNNQIADGNYTKEIIDEHTRRFGDELLGKEKREEKINKTLNDIDNALEMLSGKDKLSSFIKDMDSNESKVSQIMRDKRSMTASIEPLNAFDTAAAMPMQPQRINKYESESEVQQFLKREENILAMNHSFSKIRDIKDHKSEIRTIKDGEITIDEFYGDLIFGGFGKTTKADSGGTASDPKMSTMPAGSKIGGVKGAIAEKSGGITTTPMSSPYSGGTKSSALKKGSTDPAATMESHYGSTREKDIALLTSVVERGESAKGDAGYSHWSRTKPYKYGDNIKNPPTWGEVKKTRAQNKRDGGSGAFGKYQIMGLHDKTFEKELGFTDDTVIDKDMQDTMALQLMSNKSYNLRDFEKTGDVGRMTDTISQLWAGSPRNSSNLNGGESWYKDSRTDRPQPVGTTVGNVHGRLNDYLNADIVPETDYAEKSDENEVYKAEYEKAFNKPLPDTFDNLNNDLEKAVDDINLSMFMPTDKSGASLSDINTFESRMTDIQNYEKMDEVKTNKMSDKKRDQSMVNIVQNGGGNNSGGGGGGRNTFGIFDEDMIFRRWSESQYI